MQFVFLLCTLTQRVVRKEQEMFFLAYYYYYAKCSVGVCMQYKVYDEESRSFKNKQMKIFHTKNFIFRERI